MPEPTHDLVVTDLESAAKGVLQITLARPDGADLPTWDPGAHVDLHFSFGGVEYVRQYSLCGDRADRSRWRVAVLQVVDGRGGSAGLHEGLGRGDILRVTGPRNNFALVEAAEYLFVAGGIGITPILPMIAELDASGRRWTLLYSGRTAASMAFVDEVLAYGPDRVTIHESDIAGLPDLGALVDRAGPTTVVYGCGPDPMLEALQEVCRSDPGRLHVERFARRAELDAASAGSFEVEFARSGVVAVVAADRSILQVAEESGVDIDSSCHEGICGTCETAVIAGIPDHRDDVLSAGERAEGTHMMVCVSRSCSPRLILDA